MRLALRVARVFYRLGAVCVLAAAGACSMHAVRGLSTEGLAHACADGVCTVYADTEEWVTAACARHAYKSDDGRMWDKNGRLPDGSYIAACTIYYPGRKVNPFVVYVPKLKAWRRSHEDCHIAVFKKYGLNGDHSVCENFGADKKKRRL